MSTPSTTRADLETRVAALAWINKRVTAEYRRAHDALAATMRRGAKLPAGFGERTIANASMSNPMPELVITDRQALTDWYAEHHPGHVETVHTVAGPQDEVIAVLQQHAPHLLGEDVRLCDWAVNELKTVSKGAPSAIGPEGEMDLPGCEVVRPQPRLTVTLTKEADEAMAEVAHLLTIDGRLREVTP